MPVYLCLVQLTQLITNYYQSLIAQLSLYLFTQSADQCYIFIILFLHPQLHFIIIFLLNYSEVQPLYYLSLLAPQWKSINWQLSLYFFIQIFYLLPFFLEKWLILCSDYPLMCLTHQLSQRQLLQKQIIILLLNSAKKYCLMDRLRINQSYFLLSFFVIFMYCYYLLQPLQTLMLLPSFSIKSVIKHCQQGLDLEMDGDLLRYLPPPQLQWLSLSFLSTILKWHHYYPSQQELPLFNRVLSIFKAYSLAQKWQEKYCQSLICLLNLGFSFFQSFQFLFEPWIIYLLFYQFFKGRFQLSFTVLQKDQISYFNLHFCYFQLFFFMELCCCLLEEPRQPGLHHFYARSPQQWTMHLSTFLNFWQFGYYLLSHSLFPFCSLCLTWLLSTHPISTKKRFSFFFLSSLFSHWPCLECPLPIWQCFAKKHLSPSLEQATQFLCERGLNL